MGEIMISWEDIEKIKPYYKKYMGVTVVVVSLLLYVFTLFLYKNYSPAGLDPGLHFSLLIFWLIVCTIGRILIKQFTGRKGKKDGQD